MSMLKRCRDPRKKGVVLTESGENLIMDNGWHVQSYWGDDGREYERVTRNGIVNWLVIKLVDYGEEDCDG